MSRSQPSSQQQVCEQILREGKAYNVERNILPSENAIAERLLARRLELAEAYEEVHSKLHGHDGALPAFLGLLLSTAAFWNPEKIEEARSARADLAKVNRQIAQMAADLAGLLDQRFELHNTSSFSSDTHYHVCAVIEAAAARNHLFRSYVREPLKGLRARYDLKYWPTLSDCLQAVASDAEAAAPIPSDPLTAASTTASRPSLADFFKALFASMEENSTGNHGQLPDGFKLTDDTLASLVNCALDLAVDDLVDGPYVKRLRQRARAGAG